ncbi:MAG: alpha-glucan family phosphorylase [Terracidiphilus sp.]
METDFPSQNSALNALTEIALDMRWSWNHAADDLWSQIDPELWELTRNPWAMLQTVSRERLASLACDEQFRKRLDEVILRKQRREETTSWFERTHSTPPFTRVAYFSMEFMLNDALPIYSGGLGNVAGDQLKAASDLGIPVAGVGLLYQVGYFRQHIDADGHQQALYPFNDPGQLPVRPVRQANGEWLRIELQLPGFRLWVRAWQVDVGRSKLYLLDTNDPANLPEHRGITSELYGGGPELRISQEQVLGIGGWRLLRALGIRPEVCHLNEGHAAFAVLERARDYMEEAQVSFDVALAITRTGNLFTTHTPVAAGFDLFSPALVKRHFQHYVQNALRISMADLLSLGRKHAEDASEPFSMALLALRCSGAVNGVSRLHGKVSRQLFQDIFPRWPEVEVPVGSVTNGVHVPIWDSAEADDLWTEACGKNRWESGLEEIEKDIRRVPDHRLWQARTTSRRLLVEFIRERLARQVAGHGASAEDVEMAGKIFDPDTLTLGFARRFATYKRPNLLLYDPARLLAILTHPERPVQLVIAGKAHPQDTEGQEMIRRWIEFIRHTAARSQVVFLSDYDMRLTEHLVQGVDVWLNTPRRPWEACGTSGMKVLVNGGLNLSELDGWWAEAYSPDVGWALGDGLEHGDDPAWDAAEAEQLYTLLETQVIPEFYNRDENGLPIAWINRMRESMARLTPAFSATRCVQEYTRKYYMPLANAYRKRNSDGRAAAEKLIEWRRQLTDHWPRLRFTALHVETEGNEHHFHAHVHLDELDPDAVRVQLYADSIDGSEPIRHEMTREKSLAGENTWRYSVSIPADRPAGDFTPRVIPRHPEALIPLETAHILWCPNHVRMPVDMGR